MSSVAEPNSMQTDARSILQHALDSVLPEPALRRYLKLDEASNILTVSGQKYHLGDYETIMVVGGGKAARRTGAELANMLGDRITAGVLNVYREQAKQPFSDRIQLFAAEHPTPNEEGAAGARQMVELLQRADEKSLVIALISGGGSSLMALPVAGISLEDYQAISNLLLAVPASIDEINTVRKHLDLLKGGGMRKYAQHAGSFISLVLSDVPVTQTGMVDDSSVIASGPTVGDDSTFELAKQVLAQHGIWDKAPPAVRKYIQDNLGKEGNETLPMDSSLLAEHKSQYVIIANNDQAMEAAKQKAEQLGYTAHLMGYTDKLKAEVTQEIENIWRIITPYLVNRDLITFASFSTDGIDGQSDLAGAIADQNTLELARDKELDHGEYLANYDSATFFKELDLGIKVGPSGTNVADVSLVLICNPDKPLRKIAIVFGGEATVNMILPKGRQPGFGGRNTHLALLAAEKLDQLTGTR